MPKKEPEPVVAKKLLPFMNNLPAGLREQAGKVIMEEIGKLMARVDSNESGRLMETVIQLLSDEVFRSLSFLIIGNEGDDFARGLIFEMAFRLANKMGKEFDTPDPITDAAGFIVVLINCENLRRKGYMEYLAPDDIFTSKPKFPGYNKLTESDRAKYYQEILETQMTTPKYMM